MSAGKGGGFVRIRDQGDVLEIQGDISESADATGTGGPAQNMWLVWILTTNSRVKSENQGI